jgi:hypothetical protein
VRLLPDVRLSGEESRASFVDGINDPPMIFGNPYLRG